MSAASRSHGEDRASLSTFVVPRFDAHLVQPQPFTTEDAYWQLILARLETCHAPQRTPGSSRPHCSPQRTVTMRRTTWPQQPRRKAGRRARVYVGVL